MPLPIDLKFDDMSMSSSNESNTSHNSRAAKPSKTKVAKTNVLSAKDSFWKHQGQKFKKDFRVAGTFYNMFLASLGTFIGVFLILVIFRVPFVMTTPKPTPEDPTPSPCISWASAFVWALVMAGVVCIISFFTRPKLAPTYTLEK
jgi:hypothetical protein